MIEDGFREALIRETNAKKHEYEMMKLAWNRITAKIYRVTSYMEHLNAVLVANGQEPVCLSPPVA